MLSAVTPGVNTSGSESRPQSKYAIREQHIRDLFPSGAVFHLDNHTYKVATCAKPQVSGGETKTDIFIAANEIATGANLELKISFKLPTAEFIENKLTAERALEILGENYRQLLVEAANALNLEARPKRHAGRDTYVLGYRLDLMVKPKHRAYGSKTYHPLTLPAPALRRIYAGSDSNNQKQDAYVHGYKPGTLVRNAGIADYILYDGAFTTAQHVIDHLITIEQHIIDNPEVFLAFKAVNFRMAKHNTGDPVAWDGNRPLAFFIDWHHATNTFEGKLNTDKVLTDRANSHGEAFKLLLI